MAGRTKAAAASADARPSSNPGLTRPSSPSSSSTDAHDLRPVDLDLTKEEQEFLVREARGSVAPSQVPEIGGPKLVDRIPQNVFLSAEEVRAAAEAQVASDIGDTFFKTAYLVVPFTFCYLLMDILIHQQYGQHPGVKDELSRLATTIPVLSFLIHYTNRHLNKRLTQYLLFGLCVLAGSRLIYVVNKAGWLVVIQQAPPLSTLWIFAITQLELGLAVGGLALVYGFTWWKGLALAL